MIESFALSLLDIGVLEQRPVIHLQLRPGAARPRRPRRRCVAASAAGVLKHLSAVSRDIAQSLEEDPTAADVRVEVHDYGTGRVRGRPEEDQERLPRRRERPRLMHTDDFSMAPDQARTEAALVAWGPDVRAVRAASVFSRRVRAGGCVAFFRTVADAEAVADEHCVLLRADALGYTNGIWRAEGTAMALIDRFVATSHEVARAHEPPLTSVPVDPAQARSHGRPRSGPSQPLSATGAMFLGATRYRGIRSMLSMPRWWIALVARMKAQDGFVWHAIYWMPPFSLGTIALFTSRDDLLVMARIPAHRQLMQWVTDGTRNATAGFIRLYAAPQDDA